MSEPRTNDLGQPIGPPMEDWQARPFPERVTLEGRFCRIEPLDSARHASSLWEGAQLDPEGRNWTYLAYGPFQDEAEHRRWVEWMSQSHDPQAYAIIDLGTGEAVGVATYLRIDPGNGVIEVGHLNYTPKMQRTPISTDAMYLMMRHAFEELGYRRYEWKCDSLNGPSKAAAHRLGFTYEGTFRQAVIYNGRSRDNYWLSITDGEWPAIRGALEGWLAPANFDEAGQQRERLEAFMARSRGGAA